MNNTKKIWMYVALFLLVTNLSTIASFWYHMDQEQRDVAKNIEMPAEHRTRFFKEQLGLNEEQRDAFWNLNRNYNRNANQIMRQLDQLRTEMVHELGKAACDSIKLRAITESIGDQHEQLKLATVTFYLNVKADLDANQQEKLYQLFSGLLQKQENVNIPKGRRQGRGNGRGPRHQN